MRNIHWEKYEKNPESQNSRFYWRISNPDLKPTHAYNCSGMFGADRFYLGYPAIGVLKFATLGFFFIGNSFQYEINLHCRKRCDGKSETFL